MPQKKIKIKTLCLIQTIRGQQVSHQIDTIIIKNKKKTMTKCRFEGNVKELSYYIKKKQVFYVKNLKAVKWVLVIILNDVI